MDNVQEPCNIGNDGLAAHIIHIIPCVITIAMSH